MPQSIPARRILAASASVGLAAAIACLPAGSAQANVAATFQAVGSSNAFVPGGASTCDLQVGDDDSPSTTPKQFRDGTRRASVSLDTTYTNSLDPTDVVHVKGHVDSKLTVDKRHRDLKSFTLKAGGSIKIVHTLLSSNCEATGSVLGFATMDFTEHHKGWFYLTRDTQEPNAAAIFVLVNAKTGHLKTLDLFEGGDQSHATSRVFLRPGKYSISQMAAGVALSDSGLAKSGLTPDRAASLTTTLQGEFKRKK
jgi:hypothetical protein